MAMRDPKEWARAIAESPDAKRHPDVDVLADLIREAQEDGAREWRERAREWEAQAAEFDLKLSSSDEHRGDLGSEVGRLRAQVAALTERAERAEGQRDDAANKALKAVESLNANVMARRNAHPRGCCDWSCDLCAPLLVLDEKGNG